MKNIYGISIIEAFHCVEALKRENQLHYQFIRNHNKRIKGVAQNHEEPILKT